MECNQWFLCLSVSVMCSTIAGMNIFSIGLSADEQNLAGDNVSFYLFFVVVGLALMNPFMYLMRKNF